MPKVLVIDDAQDLLLETTEGLRFEGFETLQASDGVQGLQIARESLPDIIVCDINMPEMNGFEVLRELRNDSMTASIPFIFLSARAAPSDIRTGMNLGADDYLTKPFERDALVNAIYTRLARNADLQADRLRRFSHRLVTVQENERRSFAETLKDNLADKLSDLKITLAMLGRLPHAAQATAIQTAEHLVDDAVKTIDNLSYALWPSVLTHMGLLPALLLLFDQFRQSSDLNVNFEHQGLDSIADPHKTIMIYRIIQEALMNIDRHAGVNIANVRLWVEGDALHMQIEDHGIGFDLEKVLNDVTKAGIINMQERAYLLNGKLTILSSINEGTQIIGAFPLTDHEIPRGSEPIGRKPKVRRTPATTPVVAAVQKPTVSHSSSSVRIAIADSNDIMRWGIRSVLDAQNNVTVVSELSNWSELLGFLDGNTVDILIVSLGLAGNDSGIDFVRQISDASPDMRILLMSNYIEYSYAAEALRNGAHGYMLKSSSMDELLEAIGVVASGQQYVAKDVVGSRQPASILSQSDGTLDTFSTLTDREKEIFSLVVNGKTSQEIADKLIISSRTVETHRRNMMHKLGLKGMSALVRFAMDRGMIGNNA